MPPSFDQNRHDFHVITVAKISIRLMRLASDRCLWKGRVTARGQLKGDDDDDNRSLTVFSLGEGGEILDSQSNYRPRP